MIPKSGYLFSEACPRAGPEGSCSNKKATAGWRFNEESFWLAERSPLLVASRFHEFEEAAQLAVLRVFLVKEFKIAIVEDAKELVPRSGTELGFGLVEVNAQDLGVLDRVTRRPERAFREEARPVEAGRDVEAVFPVRELGADLRVEGRRVRVL